MDEGHIRINPYAVSPRRAISLMADICSGNPDVDVESGRSELEDFVEKSFEKDWRVANASSLGNPLLFSELSKLFEGLSFAVANEFFGNYKRVRVAITGMTATGKSSLINFLMKSPNLLPVNANPSTILPTHIFCSNWRGATKAYAVNHRNAIIQVDLNAISGIQHTTDFSTESMAQGLAEQISYSMSRFIVECHHENFNNIEFIDSPGFNVNVSDDDSAKRCWENSDVVLFLVDTNACFQRKDKEILAKIKKPVLLVANRNNLMMSRQDVVKNFISICESVKDFNNILDCVCLSSKDPTMYGFFSRSGIESMDVLKSMEEAINLLASQKSAHTEIDSILEEIKRLLKDESEFQEKRIKKLENERASINSYRAAKLSTEYIQNKSVSEEVCHELKRMSNLNSVLSEDKFYNRFCFLKDYYITSEQEKDNQLSRLFELHSKTIEHCKDVRHRLDRLYEDIKKWYESRKDKLGTDRVTAAVRQLPEVPDTPFEAIDNVYDVEQESLVEALSAEEGYNVLKDYNESGYSLLTYAAFRGNVPALKLIISALGRDRLVRKTDGKKRNVLHAAAEGRNISLFNCLKEKYPSLVKQKDELGRTPEDIVQDCTDNNNI